MLTQVIPGLVDGPAIDAGTALVGTDLLPRLFEVLSFAHLLDQRLCQSPGFGVLASPRVIRSLHSGVRVSPRLSVMKASGSCWYWIFGRMSPMSCKAYWPPPSFGPSAARSRSCEPWPFLPFRASVPLERTDGFGLLCPLLTSAPRSGWPHGFLSPSPTDVGSGHDADLPR